MNVKFLFNDKERVGDWVAKKVGQRASWGSFYAIGVERDGKIVAGTVFNNYNGVNATAHIAIEKTGKYVIELIKHFCYYAYCVAKVKRLTGLVPASNIKVIEFDKHIGFEEECRLKQAASDGGDLVVLVMWADKCRWINVDEYRRINNG